MFAHRVKISASVGDGMALEYPSLVTESTLQRQVLRESLAKPGAGAREVKAAVFWHGGEAFRNTSGMDRGGSLSFWKVFRPGCVLPSRQGPGFPAG